MLKRLMKSAAARAGYRVIRASLHNCSDLRFAKMLSHHQIDLVLDVGANQGQYGQMLREVGYQGDIVSFEPLSAPHAVLRETASQDPRWHVPDPVALGSESGDVLIEVAGNVHSSSILKVASLHEEAAPESRTVRQEEVTLARLDEVAGPWMGQGRRGFLKVDVQGYESQVLDGATGIIDQMQGLQMELSLAPLYQGQADWIAMIQRVSELGFFCEGLEPIFSQPTTGRLLQADGLFFRQT